MGIDGGLEMLDVAEATSRFLHPLDRRVDGFDSRFGDAVLQIGKHVEEVASDELRDFRHRSQSTVGGSPEPAGKGPKRCQELRAPHKPVRTFIELREKCLA